MQSAHRECRHPIAYAPDAHPKRGYFACMCTFPTINCAALRWRTQCVRLPASSAHPEPDRAQRMNCCASRPAIPRHPDHRIRQASITAQRTTQHRFHPASQMSSHNIGNNEAIPHVGDGFAFQTNSGRSGGRKRLMLLIRPHTHTEQEIASATGRRNNGASARVQSSAPRPSTRPGSTATPRAPSSATRQYPWHYPLAG